MDGKVIGLLFHMKHILEFNLYNLTHKITEMLIFHYTTADFSHKAYLCHAILFPSAWLANRKVILHLRIVLCTGVSDLHFYLSFESVIHCYHLY